jgi:hypothetical protein
MARKKETGERSESVEALANPLIGDGWGEVVGRIPVDLEATARAAGLMVRNREVRSASDLLRIVLAYALCDWSLRVVGVWSHLIGLGELSDVAVLKRVRSCQVWLGQIVLGCLLARRVEFAEVGVRLRLIDATCVSRPGSRGTDWRVHLSLDLGAQAFDGVEITDAKGGETLVRHSARAGDIEVGDRGYGHRRGLGVAMSRGAWLVVRIGWQNLPLSTVDGRRFDLIGWLREVPTEGPTEQSVRVQTPNGEFGLRLVAQRLSDAAIGAARRRIREQARKKGRTPDQRSLDAAGFIFVVTNLPAERWSSGDVLALYRIRWQIELQIKQLKGILQLDQLRAKSPALAQAYLLAKLLGALLTQGVNGRIAAEQAEWFESVVRPVSSWRLLVVLAEALHQAVRSIITLEMILASLPALARYLRDSPRRRRQQAAQARAFLLALNAA